MGDKSKIEWTEATWNPVSGCSKVSAGCKNCYAERLFPRVYQGRAFTDVKMHENRLEQPLRWKKPRRIFVNSMSDLFHEDVPDSFIDKVFAVMALSPQHTFQILTKRPERMRKYFNGPFYPMSRVHAQLFASWPGKNPNDATPAWPLPNVWLGVSVEDQATADERIPLLLQTPAAIRFVSYEPALGPVDFSRIMASRMPWHPPGPPECLHLDSLKGTVSTIQRAKAVHTEQCSPLDWIIVGGESGPGARPSHPLGGKEFHEFPGLVSIGARPMQGGEGAVFHEAVGGVASMSPRRF